MKLSANVRLGAICGALALATAGLLGGLSLGVSANAAPPAHFEAIVNLGAANATAGQTFATTSYADLAAATISVPVQTNRGIAVTEAPGTPSVSDIIRVTWSADVIKATSTTGTCAVYVNGAVVAASSRTIDTAAKQGSMGGFYSVSRVDNAAQTVKLQCKSGDTAVFTVNNANIRVEEVYRNA